MAGRDWSGLGDNWRDIGGTFARGAPVAAVARNPTQLDLFATGKDGWVYTSWANKPEAPLPVSPN